MTNEAVPYLLARGEKSTRKKTQQVSSDTYLPLVVMLVTGEGTRAMNTCLCVAHFSRGTSQNSDLYRPLLERHALVFRPFPPGHRSLTPGSADFSLDVLWLQGSGADDSTGWCSLSRSVCRLI